MYNYIDLVTLIPLAQAMGIRLDTLAKLSGVPVPSLESLLATGDCPDMDRETHLYLRGLLGMLVYGTEEDPLLRLTLILRDLSEGFGFSDRYLADLCGVKEADIDALRRGETVDAETRFRMAVGVIMLHRICVWPDFERGAAQYERLYPTPREDADE